jgi:hypothetical protein
MSKELQLLCYFVGATVGIVYVFQEYRLQKSSSRIEQYPRLKNLFYLIGTSSLGFIIDWKSLAKLGGQDVNIDRFEVWIHYALATSITICTLLIGTIIWIIAENTRRNRLIPSAIQISPLSAIGLFLQRGYFAYEKK